jgi:hypothetical protein
VSECYTTYLYNSYVFLFSDIAIRALGEGITTEIVNAIIALLKPFIQGDMLGFIEDKMKSTLEEALVDFDIREIFNQ